MRKIKLIFILVLSVFKIAFSQTNDEFYIKETVLNYADGFYSGDAARLEKALHPDLNKVIVNRLPASNSYYLQYSTISELIEYTKTNSGFVEKEKRNIEIKILSLDSSFAAVKLKSAFFNDYIQLINIEGTWKIVNVLWSYVPASNISTMENEEENLKKGIFDFYSFDPERIENTLHPEICLAQFKTLPKTDIKIISKHGLSYIIGITNEGYFKKMIDIKDISFEIIDFINEMAYVQVNTSNSVMCFQVQFINNQWKVINILWLR